MVYPVSKPRLANRSAKFGVGSFTETLIGAEIVMAPRLSVARAVKT